MAELLEVESTQGVTNATIPDGEAADVVLKKLAGLRVSESTVERASEAVGDDIGRRLAAGATFGAARPWAWHKDADGKTCAYVSLDLTGLGVQGPDGVAAEGRMAAVGMVYNPVPEDAARWARPQGRVPQSQARYVAALGGRRRRPNRCGTKRPRSAWIAPSAGSPSATPGPAWKTCCG
ncbi:MAG: hypothetical protein LC749_17480 [Actinobacteria bacterium]|nr:hypothetical protein [Actinomycetota bacterium]